jgi:hypothetical protein
MNGVPGVTFEPFDKVELTSTGGVTAISFVNTIKEETKKKTDQEVLETLASSDQSMKYIVMGRNDEYHEIGNNSLRPFGTIIEAIAYGEQLTTRNSRGYRLYHSFLIQPLLKDKNSFELTGDQIVMIRNIEDRLLSG